jgi:hypothetical protein
MGRHASAAKATSVRPRSDQVADGRAVRQIVVVEMHVRPRREVPRVMP